VCDSLGSEGGEPTCEAEDIVDKEQHILTLFVAEVPKRKISSRKYMSLVKNLLSNGKTSKGDTGTGTRGLVHLTEDKGDLGVTVKLNDGSLLHLVVQIVTLTGTLTDTCEDGETTVGLGDVVLPIVS